MRLRWAFAVVAPLLAPAALALYVVWQRSISNDWAAGPGLALTVAAPIAALWAVLLAPSRTARIAAVLALLLSLANAALWWEAVSKLVRSS